MHESLVGEHCKCCKTPALVPPTRDGTNWTEHGSIGTCLGKLHHWCDT